MASSNIICTLLLVKPKAVRVRTGELVIVPDGATVEAFRGQPHCALANLVDDDNAAAKFVRAFGPVAQDYFVSNAQAPQYFVGAAAELIPELLNEYPDADFYLHPKEVLLKQSALLRRAWEGEQYAIREIEDYISANIGINGYFKKGRVAITLPNAWAAVGVLFLRDRAAKKTAICENPDCPARYFIRTRSTQKFCEAGTCTEYGARLRANKWWKAHGNEWRSERHRKENK
jgi:hypothetical protein